MGSGGLSPRFLDIGTGITSANNTHEVAEPAAPECRKPRPKFALQLD
ncbi:MAG TPA: SAM-dependent methyltransferase [Streptosporangiaceae bacterium]|nr:SAM-dependent methyltransferase [Streptosporangiaceae bacterium]